MKLMRVSFRAVEWQVYEIEVDDDFPEDSYEAIWEERVKNTFDWIPVETDLASEEIEEVEFKAIDD